MMKLVEQHIIKDASFLEVCVKAKNLYNVIYKILNMVNGDFYIGSAIDFNRRKANHISQLNNNCHPNAHLQRAWFKYGIVNFEFSIVDEVEDGSSLIDREQYFIDGLKPKYNIRKVAHSNLGIKMSEQHKMKTSIALTGRPVSDETRLKMSLSQTGKVHSQERRKQNSMLRKEESKLKIGVKRPLDVCSKISATKRKNGITELQKLAKNKKVINTMTDEIFESAKHLAYILKVSYPNLARKLRGERPNDTVYQYLSASKDEIQISDLVLSCVSQPKKLNILYNKCEPLKYLVNT